MNSKDGKKRDIYSSEIKDLLKDAENLKLKQDKMVDYFKNACLRLSNNN